MNVMLSTTQQQLAHIPYLVAIVDCIQVGLPTAWLLWDLEKVIRIANNKQAGRYESVHFDDTYLFFLVSLDQKPSSHGCALEHLESLVLQL